MDKLAKTISSQCKEDGKKKGLNKPFYWSKYIYFTDMHILVKAPATLFTEQYPRNRQNSSLNTTYFNKEDNNCNLPVEINEKLSNQLKGHELSSDKDVIVIFHKGVFTLYYVKILYQISQIISEDIYILRDSINKGSLFKIGTVMVFLCNALYGKDENKSKK